jgi:sugar transferase (PEP-CTERM/EpsH1 system associated)
MYNFAKILTKKYLVDLLAINEGRVREQHVNELRKVFNEVIVHPFHPLRFKINTLRGLFCNDSLQVFYHHFGKVQRWVIKHYKQYDLLFCFHVRMAKYLENIVERPKVIDLIDATSINYQEAQRFSKGLWRYIYSIENKRLLTYELKMLGKFDLAFITSRYDKAFLEKNAGRIFEHLVVVPNGVREELFARPMTGEEEDWVVFLGRMSYAPNIDAVLYFTHKVFPLIRKEKPVKFLIVGTDPAKEVLKLQKIKDIEVTGFVEDPYEYLLKAKVVVAPIRFSAGIQNKILEAMALRKAVVTTSKGARGILGEDGKHFLVADDPQGMAEKVLLLLQDQGIRKELGDNAYGLIKNVYRWDIISEKLLFQLEQILKA